MMLQISQTLLLALTIFFLDVFPSQATGCSDETAALSETATLQQLEQEINQELDSEFQACMETATTTATCTFDHSKYSATANYKAACTSAGGKVLVFDARLICSANGVGLNVFENNEPLCVSKNCAASEVEALYDIILDNIELELEGYGWVCTSDAAVDTSDAAVDTPDAAVNTSGSSHCDACFALNMLLLSLLLGSLFLY